MSGDHGLTRSGGRAGERVFIGVCMAAVGLPLAILVWLVGDVVVEGIGRIDWDFLTSAPSRKAGEAGIMPALVGSLYLIGLTAAFALPIGVGAAVWLEEYGSRRRRLASFIEVNIANLAGVPSVIYGLLGLGVFVRFLETGRSLLAGALTLALLVLPIVIMTSREALRAVPHGLREASWGLGATKWQTIRGVVLPMALPGILTGAILAISRAIGETAPLIVVGALAYMPCLPAGPTEPFTALPIQIYNWVSRPQAEFQANAAAGIVVLIATMLLMNTVAIVLRNRLQRKVH